MAKKISLNSAYGAIGNQYFRYFKLANAEAITLSGQVSIRWIENRMNKRLNKILKTENTDYVIASDTDSIYLNLGPFVDAVFKGREKTPEQVVDFLNKVCEVEFEPYIESSYQALADYVNAYDQKMQMKRENIADRGIWTAKKRYILNVWDSEGVRYAEPKLKIMGIEAVKSSTPAPCRQMIKDGLKLVMSGTEDEVIDFIEKSRKDFRALPPEEISFPRSVSNVVKYKGANTIYAKGTPMHVRGALLFNFYIKERGLDKKYAYIQNGEKIKFCYLKNPNPTRENVISFIQDFPKELDLERFIDYEMQFNKAFLEPVKTILDAIGWSVEKKVSLESFFSWVTLFCGQSKDQEIFLLGRKEKSLKVNTKQIGLQIILKRVIIGSSVSNLKTLRRIKLELPINDKELATIISAMRLGGDGALYQKLKNIQEVRNENPGGAYKKILREQYGMVA